MNSTCLRLFENAPNGIFVTAPDGRYLRVNPALARIYGYSSPADLLAAQPLLHQRLYVDPTRRQAFVQQLEACDRLTDFKAQVYRQDGSTTWTLETAWAVRDEAGQLLHYEGFVEDIRDRMERHAIEVALCQSEARYRTLVTASAQIVWIADAEGLIQDDIPSWRAFTGQTEAEIKGWNWLAALHPDDRDRTRHLWSEAVRKTETYLTEYRVRSVTGEYHQFAVRGVPILNDDGTVREWVGTCTDITIQRQAEAALQRNNTIFYSIIDTSPDLIFVKDLEGRFVLANIHTANWLGVPVAELLGKRNSELCSESVAAVLEQGDRQVITSGQPFTYEETLPCQGEPRTLLTTKCPWFDAAGNVVGVIGISRDISERRQTEEALRLAQNRYTLASQAGQVGVWDWDLNTNEIYLDPILKAILGYEDHEITNHLDDWGQYIYAEDAPAVMAAAQAHIEGQSAEFHIEHRMHHKDGSLRWILARGTVLRDEHGTPYRMMGTDTDITCLKQAEAAIRALNADLEQRVEERTQALEAMNLELLREVAERRRTEAALRQSEEKFRRLAENVPGVIYRYVWHPDGRDEFTYINPRCWEIYELSPAEILKNAQLMWLRVHPDDVRGIEEGIELSRLRMQPFFAEYRICMPDGRVKWIQAYSQPEALPDGGVAWDGLFIDVSDRKATEEQLRLSLCEKEALLAEIHHRVKNNLQIISSLLNLQANRVDDPQTQRALEDSWSRIDSMALVHETLYQTQDFSHIRFSAYLKNLSTNLFRSYTRPGDQIKLEVKADEHLCLSLDQAIPCGLIVNELITNALKHGFPQERVGLVAIALTTRPDGKIVLSVSNDGVGLPAQFNLKQTRSMGLRLVTSLVEQLEGTLELDQGELTTFRIIFEAALPSDEAYSSGTSPLPSAQPGT